MSSSSLLDPRTLGLASCGDNVIIRSTVRIVRPERIHIGSHVMIDDFVFIGGHDELVIGNHVHIGVHTALIGGGRCYISDFAGMSIGVKVMCGSDDFLGGGLTNPTIPAPYRAVHRGCVWMGPHSGLGAGTIVLPDVAVAEGAMTSAGSVVTRSLAAWGIYGGNPARRIKPRPSEEILRREAALIASEPAYARSWRDPVYPELMPEADGSVG
jgi:galactoside O-acetyltransferase